MKTQFIQVCGVLLTQILTAAALLAQTPFPLSHGPRELAVLRLLPSPLSLREIGAQLYVSLNTIKSHTRSIYRKLDAGARDDAVDRARQLELI